MKNFMMITFLALSLTACKTTVQDGPTKVTIQDGHEHDGHPHDGGFCPPGQAKKGNC
jgi:hypothetical protein